MNDLIAFEFLSRIVEAKIRSHRLLRWCVVHDKDRYKQLVDEDLIIWTKTERDINLDWKLFQDEIGYLKDDMNRSEDFSMRLQLSNGTLHIYTICDKDDSIVMEIYIVPKIVTD